MKKIDVSSSEILMNIAKDETIKTDFTFRDLVSALHERAFGMALLVFSLPSALPFSMIPGFSVFFSIPILFFAIQMIFGKKSLWLPNFIANRQIPHQKLANVIFKTTPYLKKVERLLAPRLAWMNSLVAESITGIFIALLAILLILPIPFSNFIVSLLLIFFALGITEKDGLVLAICWLSTIIILILINTFIVAIFKHFF